MINFFEKCRIIISTYPDTNFSEALYSDIPSILVYPKEFYLFSDLGNVIVEKLSSVGILFHSPVLAAKHVNTN